jgi:hypothetical protein
MLQSKRMFAALAADGRQGVSANKATPEDFKRPASFFVAE